HRTTWHCQTYHRGCTQVFGASYYDYWLKPKVDAYFRLLSWPKRLLKAKSNLTPRVGLKLLPLSTATGSISSYRNYSAGLSLLIEKIYPRSPIGTVDQQTILQRFCPLGDPA